MSNRTKILRTLVVLGVLACIAGAGVFSAFSSQTDNPGNVVTAGTVTLSDNDAGSALYALTAAKPGDSQTSCVKVTYTGSLNASVKLYTPSTIGELGPFVNLKIEPGTQASPSFPSCTGFTPDSKKPSDSVRYGRPSTIATNGCPTSCDTWRGPSLVCTQVSAVTHGFVAAIVSQ